MTEPTLTEKLTKNVFHLHLLLENPEPGLFTWNQAVLELWREIADLWESTKEK